MDWKIIIQIAAAIISILGFIYWIFDRILNPADNMAHDSQFESDIITILKENSSHLVYTGFYHYSDKRPPITYQERLFDSSVVRYLKYVSGEKRSINYKSFIRKLFSVIKYLNKKFQPLQQGILVRAIFDVEHGGFFYHKVTDAEYIFGVCLNQSEMTEADKEMDRIVEQVLIYLGHKKQQESQKDDCEVN